MKRETIITAIVFFAAGFLAGYITDAQVNWNARQKATAATSSGSDGALPTGNPTGPATTAAGVPTNLPEGHPPVDTAAFIQMLQDEASKNPKDPQLRLKLANFLYDQRQYAQAIEWYQRALELDPKNVNARTDLGTAYFYSGQPQEALREYQKSLAIDPRHEPTLYNIVIVNLEGTHDLLAARKTWEQLQKVNPNHPGLSNLKPRLEAANASGGSGAVPR